MDLALGIFPLWWLAGAIIIGLKLSLAWAGNQIEQGKTGVFNCLVPALFIWFFTSMFWPLFVYLRWKYRKKQSDEVASD